ncbi:MAG: DMT family transporter [Rhabdochlamydiaceae bacterium]|nr:DMT family transporter [Rhabdochlamydiaceae bacterium]
MKEHKPHFEKGILFMLLSAACLSLFTLFIKLSNEAVDFFLLAFLRFILPLVLIVAYMWQRGSLHGLFPMKNLKLHLIRIFCVLIYQYGIFYYLTKKSLFDATVLQNTAPLFIPLFDWLILRHKIHRTTFISMLLSFIGILLILPPDKGLFAWISLIGLVAAFAQGASQFLFGLQSNKEKTDANVFYYYFLSSIFSLFVFLVSGFFGPHLIAEVGSLKTLGTSFYLYLLALSLVSIFNQSFRGMAYKHGRPSTLAPFLYFSVPLSGLLDWIVYEHLPSLMTLLGSGFVIFGGLIHYVANRKEVRHGAK